MADLKWRELNAWFVNLDDRPDRLEHMKRELSRVGIAASRQRGMPPSEYAGDPSKVEVMRRRTPGAIGCHFSQREIIKRGTESGQHVLVMEDDLVFCDDLAERMDHIEGFLNAKPWDICWLGGTIHINPPVWHKDTLGRDAEVTDDPRIVRTYGAFCTYCYIVNTASCAKIVKLLDDNVHRSIGIDWLFIQLQPQLNTFMYLPGCCKQRDDRSSIGSGWTIFSAFSKLGPYWFASRKNDFDPISFDFAEARPCKR